MLSADSVLAPNHDPGELCRVSNCYYIVPHAGLLNFDITVFFGSKTATYILLLALLFHIDKGLHLYWHLVGLPISRGDRRLGLQG